MERSFESRVIQITDTHICGDQESVVLGIPTRKALDLVLEDVQARHPSFDLLLVTGDLSQDASLDSYRHLRRVLEGVCAPVRCIPGNHDDRERMSQTLPNLMAHVDEPLVLSHWVILLLDSVVPGAVHGALSDDALRRLERHLCELDGRHTLIAVHHPPVELASRWIDEIRLLNGNRLLSLIQQYPAVKLLIWGHAHQDYAGYCGGIRTFGTPSTCFQFKPRSSDFALDASVPGYRVFELGADGSFTSEVVRLSEFPYTAKFEAPGYN